MMPLLLAFLVVSCAIHVNSMCADISTSACEMLEKSDPTVCSNSQISETACRNYCNKCNRTCYSCSDPINGTTACNLTQECKLGELCQLREIRSSVDRHHEYTSSCADPQECDGNYFLSIVGRDSETHHDVNTRNLVVTCCPSDLCNTPLEPLTTHPTITTSTTTSTTTMTPQLTTTSPSDCNRDILVMIQTAGSDHRYVYMTIEIFTLLHSMVHDIDIGPKDNLLELIVFDDHVIPKFHFSLYLNKTSVLSGLHRAASVYHRTSLINTRVLIPFVTNNSFTSVTGDRPNYSNVIIIFVDYRAHLQTTLRSAGWTQTEWSNLSADVIVVNIGGSEKATGVLDELATDSSHILHVSGYDTVYMTKQDILRLLCK